MNIFEAVGRITSSITTLLVDLVEGTSGYVSAYKHVGEGLDTFVEVTIEEMTAESQLKLASLREGKSNQPVSEQ